jgi:hypothetical protein
MNEPDDMLRKLKEFQRRDEERQELDKKSQHTFNYINERTVLKRVPHQIPLLEILDNFELNKYADFVKFVTYFLSPCPASHLTHV